MRCRQLNASTPDGSHFWSLQVSPEMIEKYLSIESSNPLLRALLKLPGDLALIAMGGSAALVWHRASE